jgi:hypothetical protein
MTDKIDRSGCKTWCGCGNLDPRCNTDTGAFYGNDTERDRMTWPTGGRVWLAWCSPSCRDVRLPPIPAPEPAKFTHDGQTIVGDLPSSRIELAKPQHPKRAKVEVGQTWRSRRFGTLNVVAAISARGAEYVAGGWDKLESIPAYCDLLSSAPDATAKAAIMATCPKCLAQYPASSEHGCKPAPLPAKVEAAKVVPKWEPCQGCRKAICIGEYLSCATVAAHHREPMGKTTLTEAKLPALIDRRLSYQPMDDSFAGDAS